MQERWTKPGNLLLLCITTQRQAECNHSEEEEEDSPIFKSAEKTSAAPPSRGKEVTEFMGNVVVIWRKRRQRSDPAGNDLERGLICPQESQHQDELSNAALKLRKQRRRRGDGEVLHERRTEE